METPIAFTETEFIPLLEFIYHGKTLYGLFDDIYWTGPNPLPPNQVEIFMFLEPLLLGANAAAHINWIEPDDLELDKFYFIDLPWMALNQRFMDDYEAIGDYRKISYDPDTFVEIDYASNTYTVQVDGRIIAQNYTTFYPKTENVFLIYSRDAKELSENLPPEWGDNIVLFKLTEDGSNPNIPFQLNNGVIKFDVEADTPYKLVHFDTAFYLPIIIRE